MNTTHDELPLANAADVFRRGLAPLMTDEQLDALRVALVNDDARLIQGATTKPPPLPCVQDCPVEAACLLGFCGWQGDGLETVAEVEEFFARLMAGVEAEAGEENAGRYITNAWDELPRDKARAFFGGLVNDEIGRRGREKGRAA